MRKKLLIFFSIICFCLCLTGCENERDFITIHNKSELIFDNISIPTKDGYFYNIHEKFKVDDDTIAVTIYFTKEDNLGIGSWDNPKE